MSKLINKISKTRFISGINCPRFFPLFEIYKKREQATVSFKDDLSDLMEEENRENIKRLLADMYEETEDENGEAEEVDKIKLVDEQLEVMMPYYKKIEELAAKYAEHKFNIPVIFSDDTKKQKMFEAEIGGYSFYSFLDGYQEDDNQIIITESKATTTSKYLNLTYSFEKQEYNFFEKSPDGIYMTREALGLETHKPYFKKKETILKRLNNVGSYIYDLTYQRMIIEASKTTNKPIRYLLAVLNSNYIFDGEYKDSEPDYLKDINKEDFIISFIDITDLTKEFLPTLEADLDIVIDRLDHMTYDPLNPGELCPRRGKHKCMFHDICYGHIPKKNSIFTYIQGHNGFKTPSGEKYSREEMINMDMKKILDVPYSWLEREVNRIQYDVVSTTEPYIDKRRMQLILSKLKYPLYHLDFESFPGPLPRFKGEKPYTQSVFQFNLHIEHAPGVCDKDKDSYYYLATDLSDHRYELTKKLCSLIGSEGNVIAWNDAFEKGRMRELAVYFPEFKEQLYSIINRTYDLWYIFKGSHHSLYDQWNIVEKKGINYYHESLQGSFSIKKVLPIFVPELSYANLDVGNGTQALVTYAKFPKMSKKDFEFKKQALIEYCKQDTYAMVAIMASLRKLI